MVFFFSRFLLFLGLVCYVHVQARRNSSRVTKHDGFDPDALIRWARHVLGEENVENGLPRDVLEAWLFDSAEDLDLVLTRSGKDEGDHWYRHFPEWRDMEIAIVSWLSPSMAFQEGGMPASLKERLEQSDLEACKSRCGSTPVEECCSPKAACSSMKYFMERLFEKTQGLFDFYYKAADRRFKAAIAAVWPFGHGSVLLPFFGAARSTEDAVRSLAFMMSRYPSSTSIRSCLETTYGHALRESGMKVVEEWRIFSQKRDFMLWELMATSRFRNFKWGQLGHQEHLLEELWHDLSRVVMHLKRFVHWSKIVTADKGWDEVLKKEQALDKEHEETGEFGNLQLRRAVFRDTWYLDKGLLRFLMRNLLRVGETIGEFGAFGGHYSKWFNDTGVVEAFAYDGISDVHQITNGAVQELQLSEPFDLGRTFDWVLCTEVGEHLQPGMEDILLSNIARHARIGAIISWATLDYPSHLHPNLMTLEQSGALIARHGFTQDVALTEGLRVAADLDWMKASVGIYYLHGGDSRR